ncbi:MAG: hypothetical protein ABG776_18015 [Cyanobacteria bacterium J06555_13]
MKNLGPFAKAFAIAAVLFTIHIIVIFGLGDSDNSSSYEAGKVTGRIMSSYIVSALATGAIGKFAVKNAKWPTTLTIYIPVCVIFTGLRVMGASQ